MVKPMSGAPLANIANRCCFVETELEHGPLENPAGFPHLSAAGVIIILAVELFGEVLVLLVLDRPKEANAPGSSPEWPKIWHSKSVWATAKLGARW